MEIRKIIIGDVCELNYESIGKLDAPQTIHYLDTGNITKNVINNIQILDRMSSPFPSRAQRKVKNGTIIYSTVRPDQEHFGIFDNPNKNLIVSTGFLTLDVIDKEIDPRFLYYALTRREITQYLHTIAVNNVSSYPSLNPSDIGSLELDVPKEKDLQKKIATVLSTLDSKIKINIGVNTELEAMAKTLYDYWFVQFDFPDKNGKPYKSGGGKMVWNKELKREIPEGWEMKMLFDSMDVQYGFPFSTNKFTDEVTDKPVIRIRDILENTISTYTTEDVDDKYKLFQKDLLIGMDGNFHLNFWDKDGAYLNQRSVRIRSKPSSNISNFQAYFELSPYIKAREKNVSRTTVGHLSDKDLKRLYVTNAHSNNNFNPRTTFDSILRKIIINRIENQKLSELRDWLLPMLMNGQVKVN